MGLEGIISYASVLMILELDPNPIDTLGEESLH